MPAGFAHDPFPAHKPAGEIPKNLAWKIVSPPID
jgi:hypothetical protein